MPTGQPAHFKRWTEAPYTRTHLKDMKIGNIADNHADPKIRRAFGLVRRAYNDVWQLVHADINELKAIPNLGPKTRRIIKDYLAGDGIQVHWSEH